MHLVESILHHITIVVSFSVAVPKKRFAKPRIKNIMHCRIAMIRPGDFMNCWSAFDLNFNCISGNTCSLVKHLHKCPYIAHPTVRNSDVHRCQLTPYRWEN